jgi:YHS domain-containing protein
MWRAIIELCLTILIAYIARAVLQGVFRGIANASSQAFQQTRQSQPGAAAPGPPPPPASGSELHKDPVCGTYVAESTPYRRKLNSQTIYYCSEGCREKHVPVRQ